LFAMYVTPDKIKNEVITNIPEQFVSKDREEDRKDAEFIVTKYRPATDRQARAAVKTARELIGIEENMTPEQIRDDDKDIENLTLQSPGISPPSPAAAGTGTP